MTDKHTRGVRQIRFCQMNISLKKGKEQIQERLLINFVVKISTAMNVYTKFKQFSTKDKNPTKYSNLE